AVIAVVIFHFFPAHFPYGYFGVDVFFVLSGFLIGMVLDGKKTSVATISDFYLKRMRRIFPLSLLIIFTITWVVYFRMVSVISEKELIKTTINALFFTSNLKHN
ncbi:hypothetical protein PMAYCL1PPCAC_33009, partial [Pristionchus mayeri]